MKNNKLYIADLVLLWQNDFSTLFTYVMTNSPFDVTGAARKARVWD